MPYRVLIPLDGSPLAEHALVPAAELARRSGGTARLVRVHVPVVPITPFGDLAPPIYDPSWDADLRKLAEAYLMSTADSHRAAFGATPTTELREGPDVSHQIEEAAAEFGADIIAMTTHGHGGWAASWLGSIADGVIRTTHRLVLVIPERATDSSFDVKRIVVALDGSEAASAMVEPARAVAALFNAQITLVRVVAPPLVGEMLTALNSEGLDRFGVDSYAEHAKAEIDALATPLRRAGVSVEAVVLIDAHPARALLDHVRSTGADLIVMSTHGRGLSRLFVGSVADKVLRGSNCPTLIRRPG